MPQLDVRMVAAALEIDSMDRWIATLILMATAAAGGDRLLSRQFKSTTHLSAVVK